MTEDPTATDHELHPAVPAFGSAAVEYERGRPTYPPAVGELLGREFGLGPGRRVCDLAAGTGKFTRLLLALGCEVVAVEPVAGMREQLTRLLPDVEARAGTAEATGLQSSSVDVVTVAQAFHWFDAPAALGEIHRVLRPDGGLALVWNVRDESAPWVAKLTELISWYKHPASRYQTVDWAAEVAAAGGFEPLRKASVSWAQEMTRDILRDRIRSISYIAALPPDDQEVVVGRVLELVAGFDEPFALPHRTETYWCRRR
jgi:ubiquinone/menaquinone biosynthesis C-methylase UbiE